MPLSGLDAGSRVVVLQPALVVYTFAFCVVFKPRWGLDGESKADFAIMLFVALIVHGPFAEYLKLASSSPTSITSRRRVSARNPAIGGSQLGAVPFCRQRFRAACGAARVSTRAREGHHIFAAGGRPTAARCHRARVVSVLDRVYVRYIVC